MSESTSRSDGLCDRCSRFLHFKGGEHGFYAETTDEDGTVRIDFRHTRDGKDTWKVESQFQLEDNYPAMPELNRSASRGCGFCSLLLNEIQKKTPELEMIKINRVPMTFLEVPKSPPVPTLFMEGCIRQRDSHLDSFCTDGVSVRWVITDVLNKYELSELWSYGTAFRLRANQDTMAADYLRLLRTPFNPSLLCSENFAHIQRSLSNCFKTHKRCAANRPTGHSKQQALPSRLIHITKDQTGYKIRLVQMQPRTSPEPGVLHPKYAALSYCWGDQESIKSTPENITDHYNTIAFSKLPPGFQDTIELCWGIGISYLWIDSLCIIQGDQSDWDQESARMKDVYGNASLTIILASISSPLEGLSDVPTTNSSDVRVSYRLDDDKGPEITYLVGSPSSIERSAGGLRLWRVQPDAESDSEASIYTSKWMNRGWTFQESYLSARKLLICSGHTDFSCRTSSCLQGILRICRPLKDLGPYGRDSGPEDWYDLVSHYSSRKLSRSEDKLPAISAVASLMGERNGDYVAGLWTNSLERGLLWTPGRHAFGHLALKRQTTYRGPTWSWCAYDGCITYNMIDSLQHLTRAFDILEIRWTLAEPTAIYGRLSTAAGDRAYLRIRAKVAWVTIEFKDQFLGRGPVVEASDGTRMKGGPSLIDCGETDDFKGPQRVAAMLVASGTDPESTDMMSTDMISGLFLRPIPSLGSVITYERVGCFFNYNYVDEIVMFMFQDMTEAQELCLV